MYRFPSQGRQGGASCPATFFASKATSRLASKRQGLQPTSWELTVGASISEWPQQAFLHPCRVTESLKNNKRLLPA